MSTDSVLVSPYRACRRLYHGTRQGLLWLRYRYACNFVFVHIHKTGGTSVESILGLPVLHERAQAQREILGPDEYDSRFSFSIVRNPWDLNVSLYHHLRQSDQWSRDDVLPFTEWVKRMYVDEDPQYNHIAWHGRPQWWWLQNRDGSLMVDYVARLETIGDDWQTICDRIGVDTPLPHRNKSKRDRYQTYYDSESREIIGEVYKKDIKEFGYAFDD